MRISDWSSDVCSSDLRFGIDAGIHRDRQGAGRGAVLFARHRWAAVSLFGERSEEHTSELQSLMRISYAVFCLKKKKSTTFILYTLNLQAHLSNVEPANNH